MNRRIEDEPAGAEGNERDFVRSLAKGLAVLSAFGHGRDKMTLSEVAAITGQTRAAARRALLTLAALGYAAAENRQFRLTPKVLELGFAYLSSLSLWETAYPLMRGVSEATGESCSAAVLDGDDIVYVARVPARRIMSVSLGIGARLPAWATSLGRVQLAAFSTEALKAYLTRIERTAFTPHTVTDPDALFALIRRVRATGHAVVDQELEIGLISLAVPLKDRHGNVVAGLNVSSQAGSMRPDDMVSRYLPKLAEAARQITATMRG